MDNEILIREVYKRRALWDTKLRDYSKRDIVRKLWDEVAGILISDRDTVKKKWKNLRDNYRAELKKMKEKSGSAATNKRSKWVFFESLHFLRDFIDSAPLEGNLPSEEKSCFFNHKADETSSSKTFDVHQQSTTNCDGNTNMKPLLPCSIRPRKKRKAKAMEELIKLEKEKLKILKAECAIKKDSDYNFLVSLLPHFKSLSQINNLKFRVQITSALLELKQNEENAKGIMRSTSITPTPSNIQDNATQPTANTEHSEDPQIETTFDQY